MPPLNKILVTVFFSLILLITFPYIFFIDQTIQYLPGKFQIYFKDTINDQQIAKQIAVNLTCSPFLTNNSYQYYASINGYNYPRKIPLFLNKSINFECLNANSPKKKVCISAFITIYNNINK